MDDILLHQILDPIDDLVHNADGCNLLYPTIFCHETEKVPIPTVFSDDIAMPISSIDIVAFDNIGMI